MKTGFCVQKWKKACRWLMSSRRDSVVKQCTQLGHTQQLSKEIHANIGRFETGLWAFISIVVLNKCCMVPLECVEVL